MSITVAFSIYDLKAKSYGQPFYAVNADVARRIVAEVVNDPQSQLCQYSSDFRLFEVGTFDSSTGVPLSYDNPIFVCECSDLRQKRSFSPGTPSGDAVPSLLADQAE